MYSVPVTTFWSLLFGYTWANVLSNPGPSPDSAVAQQYRSSVWCIVFALIVDSFSEVPYIIGQYFLFAKLRVTTFFVLHKSKTSNLFERVERSESKVIGIVSFCFVLSVCPYACMQTQSQKLILFAKMYFCK